MANPSESRQPAPSPKNQSNQSLTSEDLRDRRRKYVWHVYLIFAIQLVISFAFTFGEILEPTAKKFLKKYCVWYALVILCLILLVMLISTIQQGWCLVPKVSANLPVNVVLLCLGTVIMAVLVAILSAPFKTDGFLIGFGISVVLCSILSLVAKYAKFDVSMNCKYTWSLTFFWVVLSIVVWFLFTESYIRSQILAWFVPFKGIILFSWWLLVCTQRVLGGRKIEFGTENAMCAAFCLFISTMSIFSCCAQTVGVFMFYADKALSRKAKIKRYN